MRYFRRILIALTTLIALTAFGGSVLISDVSAKPTQTKKKSAPKKKTSKKKKKKRKPKSRYSFPIPVPQKPETQSVGVASHGKLYNPSQVPLDGKTLRVRTSNLTRKTNYANQALVDVLQYAADVVAQKDPNAVLYIGDASDADGGPLFSHKSHQSGLDADLAIYTRDLSGKLKPDGAFFKFNARGKTADSKWVIDADLCWVFVEALLTSHYAQIQYLFIYDPLKEMILDAGRRAGADPKIIERASFVMQQPRDSSPHADHFHIRIYCPTKDQQDGCMASGVIWPWVEGVKPNSMAHVASYAGAKTALSWGVDGDSLVECYDGEADNPAKSGEPMDGDYICVDPEDPAYAEDWLAPPEDIEDGNEDEHPADGGEGD